MLLLNLGNLRQRHSDWGKDDRNRERFRLKEINQEIITYDIPISEDKWKHYNNSTPPRF